MPIAEEYIIERQGRKMVLYAGLLDEAHEKGLKSIDTKLVQIPTPENGNVAIVWAKVELEDLQEGRRTFTGVGDASPANVSRNIVPHIVRMAECVPMGSEILTRDGWRFYGQLTIGEPVLAYDVEADRCRWVPLLDTNVFEGATLWGIHGRTLQVSCTPDHTWAVRRQYSKTILRKTMDFKTPDCIIMAAQAESGHLRLGKRLASILGWLATDGSFGEHYVTDKYGRWGPYYKADIAQSKPEYVAEIRALLGSDASEAAVEPYDRKMPSGQVSTCRRSYRWTVRTRLIKELMDRTGMKAWADLPRIVLHLDQESRAAMLDAMLKGDGSRKRDSATWVFGKKRKPGVMEAWELLATLEGYALGGLKEKASDGFPYRTMRANRVANTNYLTIFLEGAAKVWCPTTELGTWVMRQNGFITITGNTRAKARALRDAVNVAEALHDDPSDDEAPAQDVAKQSEKDLQSVGAASVSVIRDDGVTARQLEELASLARRRNFRDEAIEKKWAIWERYSYVQAAEKIAEQEAILASDGEVHRSG